MSDPKVAEYTALMAEISSRFDGNSSSASSEERTPLDLSSLCARVCNGHGDEKKNSFACLHMNGVKVKPVSFVVGDDGIQMLLNETNTLDRLMKLGYEKRWVAQKVLVQKLEFRMALFPREAAVPATWEGVMQVVEQAFPQIASKITVHLPAFLSRSFEDIETEAKQGFLNGESFYSIYIKNGMGESDARYITAESLAEQKHDTCTIGEARSFLYNVIGLNDLFDGNGYTKQENGERGVKEYLTMNRLVTEFEAFAWVPLKMDQQELINLAESYRQSKVSP